MFFGVALRRGYEFGGFGGCVISLVGVRGDAVAFRGYCELCCMGLVLSCAGIRLRRGGEVFLGL